jgi:hypothetical protein
MKLKHWLIVTAFLGVTFGLGFLLIPAQVMEMYGVGSNKVVLYMNRMFGAAIIGLGGMSWMARGLPASKALRAVVLALFIYFTFGSISTLFFCLQGIANFMIWFTLGFHVPIAVALGYFFFTGQWSVSDDSHTAGRMQKVG